MGLFGKSDSRSPDDRVKEWQGKLRREDRALERQIRRIQREEDKVKVSLKQAAKKGDKDVCAILAKEIVGSRRVVSKIYSSKARINSISMQMKNQLAVVKVSGCMKKSSEVMKLMQQLINVPEIQATMMELSKEMMKAGIIEEMLEDTMEGFEDQDELEEAAQEEIDKVISEITQGALGRMPSIVKDEPALEGATAAPTAAEGSQSEEEDDMRARLEALRS